ncbi:unnamed protein product, partial [Prorocentrum cordatum]
MVKPPPEPGEELCERIGVTAKLDGDEWLRTAGWRQSVKRGELMALKDVLKACCGFRKIRYTADSSYVVRGVAKLQAESVLSAQEALQAVVNPIHRLGNSLADGIVDDIMEQVQVPWAQVKSVGFAEGMVGLIRDRASATLMASNEIEPSQAPSVKIRKEAYTKKRSWAKLLAETRHSIAYDVSVKHYSRLRRGSRVLMSAADAWPQVGNQEAPESHTVVFDGALKLHCCTKCGCIGREDVRKHVARCDEQARQMGRQSLSRIKK